MKKGIKTKRKNEEFNNTQLNLKLEIYWQRETHNKSKTYLIA